MAATGLARLSAAAAAVAGSSGGITPAARSLFPSSTNASQPHRAGASAQQMKPLTLSHSSKKSTPWFPEAAHSAKVAAAGFGEDAASSEVAKAAREAMADVEAAKARRDAREASARMSREQYYGHMSTMSGGIKRGGNENSYASDGFFDGGGEGGSRGEYGSLGHTDAAFSAAKATSRKAESVLESVRALEAAQPAEWQIRLGQIEAENVAKLGHIEAENVAMKDRIESMAVNARRINNKLTAYGEMDLEEKAPGPRAHAPPSPAPLWR